jgi:metallo-beta-lactamase class B
MLNLVLPLLLSLTSPTQQTTNNLSETLVIEKVAENAYQHTSYLNTQSFGRVGCNGLVVVSAGEAIVFDTPADLPASQELIDWITGTLKCRIRAVVPTHFHDDCLAGLEAFHTAGIPSYAHRLTITLAKAQRAPVPQKAFDKVLKLRVGTQKVEVAFVGEGHTRDNVVGYFPDERVLFGGCLVKETGANKGNLADANLTAWPTTMERLKQKYPRVRIVVPGHGKAGGRELLDYTQSLFASP